MDPSRLMFSLRVGKRLGVLGSLLVVGCTSPSGGNDPAPDAIWAGPLFMDVDHVRYPEPGTQPGQAYLLAQSKLADLDRIQGELTLLAAVLGAAASAEARHAGEEWRRPFDVMHEGARVRGYVSQRIYVTGQEIAVIVDEPGPLLLANGFMSQWSKELHLAYAPSPAILTWGRTRVEPQRDYWSLVLPWGSLSWQMQGSHRSVRFQPHSTPTRPEWAQEFQFFWDPVIGGGGVSTPNGMICWNRQLQDGVCGVQSAGPR